MSYIISHILILLATPLTCSSVLTATMKGSKMQGMQRMNPLYPLNLESDIKLALGPYHSGWYGPSIQTFGIPKYRVRNWQAEDIQGHTFSEISFIKSINFALYEYKLLYFEEGCSMLFWTPDCTTFWLF